MEVSKEGSDRQFAFSGFPASADSIEIFILIHKYVHERFKGFKLEPEELHQLTV